MAEMVLLKQALCTHPSDPFIQTFIFGYELILSRARTGDGSPMSPPHEKREFVVYGHLSYELLRTPNDRLSPP